MNKYVYAANAAAIIRSTLKSKYFFSCILRILLSITDFSEVNFRLVVSASLIIFRKFENFFSWNNLPDDKIWFDFYKKLPKVKDKNKTVVTAMG